MRFKNSLKQNLHVTLALMWGLSIVAALIGKSPFWLMVTTGVLVAFALRERLRWELAALTALSFLLAADAIFIRLEPVFPWGFELSNYVFLLLAGLVSVVVLFRSSTQKSQLQTYFKDPRIQITGYFALFGLIWVALFSLSNGYHLAWAMKNDAVWSTVMARLALQDGGINPSIRSLSSPLTSGLFAQVMSFGRENIPSEALLRHDLVRNGEIWIGLLFLASVLAIWVVVRALGQRSPLYVFMAGLVAGAVPLSWYVAGFSFQLGFYNAALPLLGLLIVWLAWKNSENSPRVAVMVLSLSSLILLSSWAPLAAISLVLTLIACIRQRSNIFTGVKSYSFLILFVVMVSPIFYVLFVSLPDYLRESHALASDGGMMNISPANLAAIALVGIIVPALRLLQVKGSNAFIGVTAIVLIAFFASAFLVYQRIGKEELWGYYPAKLGWLISILLIVIIISEIVSWPVRPNTRKTFSFSTIPLAILVSSVLMIQVPPSGIQDNFPNGLIRGFVPLAMTIFPTEKGLEDLAADKVLLLSNGQEKNVVFQSEQSSTLELFINGWLLQLQTEKAEDPVREFAYLLDGKDPTMLCGVEELWGPGVVVHSSNPQIGDILQSTCTGAKPRVSLE
jgi:hypothetical protein